MYIIYIPGGQLVARDLSCQVCRYTVCTINDNELWKNGRNNTFNGFNVALECL